MNPKSLDSAGPKKNPKVIYLQRFASLGPPESEARSEPEIGPGFLAFTPDGL